MVCDFFVVDTTPGCCCALAALPDEDEQSYTERMRRLWQTNPMVRQHLAVYARRHARGLVQFIGPLANVAQRIVEGIAKMRGR